MQDKMNKIKSQMEVTYNKNVSFYYFKKCINC